MATRARFSKLSRISPMRRAPILPLSCRARTPAPRHKPRQRRAHRGSLARTPTRRIGSRRPSRYLSVKRRPRQRSAARTSAPNMSLSTCFSPKPLGMILSLRRSSTNSRSRRFVVRAKRRCVTGKRRCAMQASKPLRSRRARLAECWRNRRGYRPPIDARSPARAPDNRL